MILDGVRIKGCGKFNVPALAFVDTRQGQILKNTIIETSLSKCYYSENVPDLMIQYSIIFGCNDMGV